MFIGYVIAWGGKIAKVLDQITFLPFLIPGISFAAIYLSMFAQAGPFWPALYGTFTILVLVCVGKNITYAARSGSASMVQIDRSLEEASLVLGIPWWRRFAKIIVPLARGGLVSGFILAFSTMMRELDLIILLVTPANRTLTTLAFRFAERRSLPVHERDRRNHHRRRVHHERRGLAFQPSQDHQIGGLTHEQGGTHQVDQAIRQR